MDYSFLISLYLLFGLMVYVAMAHGMEKMGKKVNFKQVVWASIGWPFVVIIGIYYLIKSEVLKNGKQSNSNR